MSQTLNYVLGTDRRALVEDVQNFRIDFSGTKNWVQARQYEAGMRQVFVNIKHEDGTPLDLTGSNVYFEGWLPEHSTDDYRVIDNHGFVPIDPQSGKFRYDFPAQAFAIAGSYRQAFFRIVKDGKSVATLEFDLEVLADKVIGGLVPRDYISPLEDLLDQALQDFKAKSASFDQILSDLKKQFADTIADLNNQGMQVTTLLTDLQSRIEALTEKEKQDGLFTQAEAEKLEQKIADSISMALSKVDQALSDVDYPITIDGGVQEPFTSALNAYSSSISADPSTARILLLTDIHYTRTLGGYGEAHKKGLLHIQQAAKVKDKVDLIVYNGDNTHGEEMIDAATNRVKQLVATHDLAFGDKKTIFTIGNHDDNNVYWSEGWRRKETLTLAQLKQLYGTDRFYDYYDVPNKDLRVVVLSAFENPEIYNSDGSIKYNRSYNSVFDSTQLNWLASEALNTNKDVIVFMHCPPKGFGLNAPYTVGGTPFVDVNHELLFGILSAFANHTTYTGTGTNSDYPASVTVDYSSKTGHFAGIIAGHEHRDSELQANNGVRVVVRLCNIAQNRELGVPTENVFDVVEVDPANHHVKLNRFGEGSSLQYDY